MRTLTLEIVTPDGRSYLAEALDEVVFHRRECLYEPGSEVAIFPLHGPLLVRIPCSSLRWVRAAETCHLALAGGFVEVKNDHVLVATPRFEEIGRDRERARGEARALAEEWRRQSADSRATMAGFG